MLEGQRESDIASIRRTLRSDAFFLRDREFLDYSVLLGVEILRGRDDQAKHLDDRKTVDRIETLREQSDATLTSRKTDDEKRKTNAEKA